MCPLVDLIKEKTASIVETAILVSYPSSEEEDNQDFVSLWKHNCQFGQFQLQCKLNRKKTFRAIDSAYNRYCVGEAMLNVETVPTIIGDEVSAYMGSMEFTERITFILIESLTAAVQDAVNPLYKSLEDLEKIVGQNTTDINSLAKSMTWTLPPSIINLTALRTNLLRQAMIKSLPNSIE